MPIASRFLSFDPTIARARGTPATNQVAAIS
jgi:hypothetical protein